MVDSDGGWGFKGILPQLHPDHHTLGTVKAHILFFSCSLGKQASELQHYVKRSRHHQKLTEHKLARFILSVFGEFS